MTCRLLKEEILELTADSTEFCPIPGLHNILAVGTYQLLDDRSTRIGKLHFYDLRADDPSAAAQLQFCAAYNCPGIFDMRWRPVKDSNGRVWIVLALADGRVSLRTVEPCTPASPLTSTILCNSDVDLQAMVLSLDFNRGPAIPGEELAASTSSGALSVLQVTSNGLQATQHWSAHSMEAWIVAYDCWKTRVVYSGADDGTFKGWDLRMPPEEGPLFTNRKAHGAGVCCIQSSHLQEHLLCTGSYDEHVRLWDTRMASAPLMLAQVSTGGGVWRLKCHPKDPELLLAACMHNGFAVLRASKSRGELRVQEEYQHQKTLGYGADWSHSVGGDGTSIAATCSFYDKLLHVWTPSTKAREAQPL